VAESGADYVRPSYYLSPPYNELNSGSAYDNPKFHVGQTANHVHVRYNPGPIG